MKWILENWQLLLQAVTIVLTVICGIMVFVRTGSLKKAIQVMKEMEDFEMMKYKTLETNKATREKGTEFSPYRDKYVLDNSTNEIEKLPTPENIQEKINSYLECALDRALERFMPKGVVEEDDVVVGYSRCRDDLAGLADAMEIAEDYREKYNLPDSMSMAEIYGFVDKQAKSLKQKLDSFAKKKNEVIEDESKKKKVEQTV